MKVRAEKRNRVVGVGKYVNVKSGVGRSVTKLSHTSLVREYIYIWASLIQYLL